MGFSLPQVEVITVADWLNEELYPRYHANKDESKKMKQEHLKGSICSPHMQVVSCTELNGQRVKIDGHSRALAWRKEQLEPPKQLLLHVYRVNSEKDIADLYRSFNSKTSSETPNEYMFHMNKLAQWEPVSMLMRASWKSVYEMMSPKYKNNEAQAILDHRQSLEILDSWGIHLKGKNNVYSVGIRVAMLKSVALNPENAKLFWDAYADPENTKYKEANALRSEVDSYKGRLGGAAVIGYLAALGFGKFEIFNEKHAK